MYRRFAWRYFRAKKSANAINIIAWVTVVVIAFATCCQLLVLSVFNGFEGLVKSLYSSFDPDIRVEAATGSTFRLSPQLLRQITALPGVGAVSAVIKDKALLRNEDAQTLVTILGVDSAFKYVSGVAGKVVEGRYETGTADAPKLVAGIGIRSAIGYTTDTTFGHDEMTLIQVRKGAVHSANIMEDLAEGNLESAGTFAIQQDFDNQYAITNIDFLRSQMALESDQYSLLALSLNPGSKPATVIKELGFLGKDFVVKDRFQQNENLYATMQLEKWAIYAVLTLILIIAAFNMISALTMLVLEKTTDIAVLKSMGTSDGGIQKIFLSEGLLLGIIGAGLGIALALLICWLQVKFHIIKLYGGSFLIDYFPVQVKVTDILLVAVTSIIISFLAAWFPAKKAAAAAVVLK